MARRLLIGITIVVMTLAGVFIPMACTSSESSARGAPQLVSIVGVTGAIPPVFGTDRAYQVSWKPLDAAGTDQFTRINLDVVTDAEAVLHVRVFDSYGQQTVRELTLVETAGGWETEAANWPTVVLDALKATGGVFRTALGVDEQHRQIEVLLTEAALPTLASLEVYAATTPDGDPWGGDRIELVREFYYLAAVGDSVMWGNGLSQRDKISYQVGRQIEQATGYKVIEQLRAMSGAHIVPELEDGRCGPNCQGETALTPNSVTLQVEQLEEAEGLDLILVSGCINDVGITAISNPDLDPETLSEWINQFCHEQMADLLHSIRAKAPQAHVAVIGYYAAVSEESDLLGFQQWMLAQGVALDTSLGAKLVAVADNWSRFFEQSNAALTAAVDEVNQADKDSAAIVFVPSGFGPADAVFASQSLLWSMSQKNTVAVDLAVDLSLFPEDPLVSYRLTRCVELPSSDDILACIYCSVGHPNVAGASRYADAVFDTLTAQQMLP